MVHFEATQKSEVGVVLQVIVDEVTTKGSPAAVFELLRDGSTWPEWSPIESFELVEAGDGETEGVGAVRIFRTGRIKSRERVITVQPNKEFGYMLVSGLAIRDYQAVVTVRPEGAGAAIQWRSTFRAKLPGTGWIYRRQLAGFVGQVLNGLSVRAAASILG
jgi:hypothetical protein